MTSIYEQTAVEQFMYVFWCLGVSLWILGYRNPDYAYIRDQSLDFLSTLIVPPKILYVLCAQPVSKKYPRGVMTAWAFSAQSFGYSFCVLGLLILLLKPSLIVLAVSFFLIDALVLTITYRMTKTKFYSDIS